MKVEGKNFRGEGQEEVQCLTVEFWYSLYSEMWYTCALEALVKAGSEKSVGYMDKLLLRPCYSLRIGEFTDTVLFVSNYSLRLIQWLIEV